MHKKASRKTQFEEFCLTPILKKLQLFTQLNFVARWMRDGCPAVLDVQRRHDKADARQIFQTGRHDASMADGAANSNQLCASSPILCKRIPVG
jgi:hypothetical protein